MPRSGITTPTSSVPSSRSGTRSVGTQMDIETVGEVSKTVPPRRPTIDDDDDCTIVYECWSVPDEGPEIGSSEIPTCPKAGDSFPCVLNEATVPVRSLLSNHFSDEAERQNFWPLLRTYAQLKSECQEPYVDTPDVEDKPEFQTTFTAVKEIKTECETPDKDYSVSTVSHTPDVEETPNLSTTLTFTDKEVKSEFQGQDQESVDEDVTELELPKATSTHNFLSPTPEVIPRSRPKIGDTVYGMKDTELDPWLRCQVLEITRPITNKKMELKCKVQFQANQRGRNGNAIRPQIIKRSEVANEDLNIKCLSLKHIAFDSPGLFVLPVGTRVIALFKDDLKTDHQAHNHYFAGIVAEPPKVSNKNRYLIFFDDGVAQYVGQGFVLLVFEASKHVWDDVQSHPKDFIKGYVESYPELPMLKLQKREAVTTEWNGKWCRGIVADVDCSLVKILFQARGRYEWIIRSSTRLAPMYERMEALQNNPVTSAPRPTNREPNLIEDADIECPCADDDGRKRSFAANTSSEKFSLKQRSDCNTKRNVARKSTASARGRGSRVSVRTVATPPKSGLPTRGFTTKDKIPIEYVGRIEEGLLQENDECPLLIRFMPHDCDFTCVEPFEERDLDSRKINPLALPVHLGWIRERAINPDKIFYRAPCGRRLRDYNDLHAFLTATEYGMGIDYFCFDYELDCLTEFVPACYNYLIRDLSFGKETAPVPCINSIDHKHPEQFTYRRDRIIAKNVGINLDPDFLACCECTDDCSNKETCACWARTIEGTNLGKGTLNPEAGYKNRRLMFSVFSGIFECNSRCQCRKTCLNRVVQNDFKCQLQIFNTLRKGWAIRSLHDIPAGSFICVYSGKILTEHEANKNGQTFGDEYLTSLDYIEVVESAKEGYEAEAQEDANMAKASPAKPRYKGYRVGRKRRRTKASQPETPKSGTKSGQPRVSTRALFGPDQECYIIDAKVYGNVGRYLNHSCRPNVFVQNVFVDTHDPRFPWVALFASKLIKPGTELTWDYNYVVDSVPGKTLDCQCGSAECRGRLL